jgi:hypothetical protein
MYILSVSPITKTPKVEAFSYFSKEKIEAGKIVSIPLRNKIVKGLVIDCKNFKENKSEIRNSEFALKKIKGVSSNFLFTQAFLETCQKTAEYFATSQGAILHTIISKIILDSVEKIIQKEKKKKYQKMNLVNLLFNLPIMNVFKIIKVLFVAVLLKKVLSSFVCQLLKM